MSQILYISLKKKLEPALAFARRYPDLCTNMKNSDLVAMEDLIEEQAESIKALDQRLADLFDRLPEDLKAEVAAEWVGGNEDGN